MRIKNQISIIQNEHIDDKNQQFSFDLRQNGQDYDDGGAEKANFLPQLNLSRNHQNSSNCNILMLNNSNM